MKLLEQFIQNVKDVIVVLETVVILVAIVIVPMKLEQVVQAVTVRAKLEIVKALVLVALECVATTLVILMLGRGVHH